MFIRTIIGVLDQKNLMKMNNDKEFPIFNLRYSALWEDIKISKNTAPKYFINFVFRRLMIASIIVIPP